MWNRLPVLLSLILYFLIFWLRSIQGGWEIKVDLFKSQRNFLDQKISQLLPSPRAELLSGILLGQNKNLPGKIKLALRDTSTLHIVVASGQNLSMVAGLFLGLSGILKRKNAIIISLIASLLYTLLTGFQVPIMRSAIMFSLTGLAQLLGRQKDGIRVLIVTAGLMLWVNPGWITDLSFQLSFMATMGVMVIAPILLKYLHSIPIISQDLAVSLGAQFMVTPIIAQNFHQFSIVGILTNLFVLWTVSFIMISGTVMLVLSFVSTMLAQWVSVLVSALLTYFIYIVQFFASLPFAWEYVGEKLWIVWAGYYLILIAVMLLLNNGKRQDSSGPEKNFR